jgi:hypothetical protein
MKTILLTATLLISAATIAQEDYNFVPQYFYLNQQADLLQQYLKQNPNTNPVFQPRYIAVDSTFVATRKEHLQAIIYEVNGQKLVVYERKKTTPKL